MSETAIVTPPLTLRDRMVIGTVRALGKPALALIGDARVIRGLTNPPAKWLKFCPAGSKVTEDEDGSLRVAPPGIGPDAPWLIYLHGGGFLAGSPYTHLGLAGHLAGFAGMNAYIPAYGLAPERPFPAGRDDLYAKYKTHVDRYGPPAALCGDSAGGNLTLLVAQHARDSGWPLPGALGLLSPVADLSEDIAERMQGATDEMLFPQHRLYQIRDTYLQGHDPRDPGASPLLGDVTGLPPTLIQASAVEAAAPDAKALGEKMDNAQVQLWDGLPHVWQIFVGRAPVADAALRAMAAFLADPS
ncbi:alpha/beta hydrolase fold domain-containing protein [Gymnodinialimonas sp. 2305UL16-5]|uniref:alpha/beta hydrolase fold domain-containing protein n=1 Tax=Gymnodinialimonas mytili TaxID=3126503 RepID=UPI003096BC81